MAEVSNDQFDGVILVSDEPSDGESPRFGRYALVGLMTFSLSLLFMGGEQAAPPNRLAFSETSSSAASAAWVLGLAVVLWLAAGFAVYRAVGRESAQPRQF